MTKFYQKLIRLSILGLLFLHTSPNSLLAETYSYMEMGNSWSADNAWEGGHRPPNIIPAGDAVIIRGYCDLDMDIRLERGAILTIATDATLFASRNIGIENHGKWVIEGNFIADGMTINNYGDLYCLPTSHQMFLCERSDARWNNFGLLTVGADVQLDQVMGILNNEREGKLTIDGIYAHTGGEFIQNGTLNGRGKFVNSASTVRELLNDGVVAPGNSPGTLEIMGNFHNQRTLEIELGGPDRGVNHDYLKIGGQANLEGTLDIKFYNGYVPQNREKFLIITGGTVVSRFSSINVPAGYRLYFINYTGSEVIIALETVTTLPISLTHFSAKKDQNNVQLQWSTEVETNSKGVAIQHSTDGKIWQNIGFSKSAGKASDYAFTHTEPAFLNYYRLEQVDNDDKKSLSTIISIQFDQKKGPLSIFPNPTTDVANFRFETAEKAQLRIVDIAGKVIFENFAAQTTEMAWHTEGSPRGVYFAVLTTEKGRFTQKIFVK